MTGLHEALQAHTDNARRAVQYAVTTKEIIDSAKVPGFAEANWDPLRELVEVDGFIRVGNFKETMDWPGYVGFLTNWAPAAEWDATFKSVTESGNRVFLELEERSAVGDFDSVVNSMSVYEFNPDGKITRIDVFLQMPMLSPELLAGYDGVEISE